MRSPVWRVLDTSGVTTSSRIFKKIHLPLHRTLPVSPTKKPNDGDAVAVKEFKEEWMLKEEEEYEELNMGLLSIQEWNEWYPLTSIFPLCASLLIC